MTRRVVTLGTHGALTAQNFGPILALSPFGEDGRRGWSVSSPHPLLVPLGEYPDVDVRPPAPALATHTATYKVGYGEVIAISLSYGQEIHRGAVWALSILTVDVHAMSAADLLPDGSYVRRLLGRLRHG